MPSRILLAYGDPMRLKNRLPSRVRGLVSVLVLTLLFSLTATWGAEGQTRDTAGAAIPGWSLAKTGSLEVSAFSDYDAWLVEVDGDVHSNRTPGLIAVSFVGYFLTSPFTTEFVFWPATLMAVLTSAVAVAFAAAAARRLSQVPVWLSLVIFGLATSMWSIASDQLWPHGPAAMFITMAVWFLADDQEWLAGAALGAALLIRPPVAVIALVVGFGLALYRKSARPLIQIGVTSAIGAVLYLAYNRILFKSWSPLAVYDAGVGLGDPTQPVSNRFENVFDVLFSARYGVLVWTPWIIVGALALRRVWKSFPDWSRLLLIAALVYVVVHVQYNRVSGGLPYNYRYAIEAVALAAPAFIAAMYAQRSDRILKYATVATVLVALGLQFTFMFVAECTGIGTASPRCGLFGL